VPQVSKTFERKAASISPVQDNTVPGGDQVGVAPGPREHKRGRPLAKDQMTTFEATKPWVAEGISRATWFRRQATKKQ
jgi:hypothetical protein